MLKDGDIHHVGILSPAYNVSTLLCLILDGSPDVIGAGETHWIWDPDAAMPERCECRSCHPNPCPVFSAELAKQLRADQNRWYQRIALTAQKRTIVSSDKMQRYYNILGHPHTALLPYRDPCAWVVGWVSREMGMGRAPLRICTPERITDAIEVLCRQWEQRLSWVDKHGIAAVSIDMHAFFDRPRHYLKFLSEALRIAFEPNALQYWTLPHHFIAGNYSMGPGRSVGTALARNDSWRSALTVAQADYIRHHPFVIRTYARLRALHCVLPVEGSCA